MTGTDRPLQWYANAPLAVRAHVALRWATCPFGAIEELVPASGRILDWGCGHGLFGLWLAQRSADRSIHGVDIDLDKLVAAREATAGSPFGERVDFAPVTPDEAPSGSWEAVVVTDVLYLLDEAQQRATIAAAGAALAPGGTLVVKEMASRPRWKARLTQAQEQVVVRGLRLTATADGIHPAPAPELLVDVMEDAGLRCEVVPLDRGYHCPHVAVVGRKPEVSGAADTLSP